MDYRAVAFTGPSNSGKTTLIEKIARRLAQERSIAIIKHDPSDKALFDREGKDSDKFFKTGADVAVLSPSRTTLFSHRERSLEEVCELFGGFDLLLVEGLKTLPLPRIAVFRNEIDESYLPVSEAIAIDESIDISRYNLDSRLDILDLNDVSQIVEWIDLHSVRLKG